MRSPRPPRSTGTASPASGALRGMRAGTLATLCVLLPLAGHVLARCHAPRWIIVAAVAAVAVPGAALLTRRRLTDAQVLGALAAAQIASHLAYTLPGACQAMAGQRTPTGALLALVERHGTVAEPGPPAGVLLAGHLIGVVIAARLLGVGERLLWQSGPALAALTAVRRLLLFVWPRLGPPRGTGPRVVVRERSAPPRSAPPVRRHAGRAPPRGGRLTPAPLLAPFRPSPTGGPVLL
ncbi:hypothetical protein [Streptomyces sp. NPDC088789]|uniref:hypothetical protein n=1 Tax=Streptomyces sp. NPDC088789 TaxID=3365899 RepID=UPI0037F532FA